MHPFAAASLVAKQPADFVKSAATALARRAVAVRAEKRAAGNPFAQAGDWLSGKAHQVGDWAGKEMASSGMNHMGDSIKGWWGDPNNAAMRNGLIGAGAGGLAGLGLSALSDEEDSHPVSSALTGALAGGALGGFGTYAKQHYDQVSNAKTPPSESEKAHQDAEALAEQYHKAHDGGPGAQLARKVGGGAWDVAKSPFGRWTAGTAAAINAPFLARGMYNRSGRNFNQFNRGLDSLMPSGAAGGAPTAWQTAIGGADSAARKEALRYYTSGGSRAPVSPAAGSLVSELETGRGITPNTFRDMISRPGAEAIAKDSRLLPRSLESGMHLGVRAGIPLAIGAWMQGRQTDQEAAQEQAAMEGLWGSGGAPGHATGGMAANPGWDEFAKAHNLPLK